MKYTKKEVQKEKQYSNALYKFHPQLMKLPSKKLEQRAFNMRPKREEHMLLIVIDKSTHEGHLFQSLQTDNKQYKIAITFLTGYNELFNVTNSNNKFYSTKSFTHKDRFIRITNAPGAYEIESLINEIKRLNFEHFTEATCPVTIKHNF